MTAFRGRTIHKVKMKNKPIDEGYKTWMVAEHGYTLTWLWHSKQDGPEDIPENGIQSSNWTFRISLSGSDIRHRYLLRPITS